MAAPEEGEAEEGVPSGAARSLGAANVPQAPEEAAGSTPAQPPRDGAASEGGAEVIRRSAAGAAATALVGLLARGAGLLTTVVVAQFVSKAEYGNANLAMIVVGVLHTLTLLTPQQALLTRRDRFEEASALVRCYVGWSGLALAALLLLVGRPVVAALGQPEAAALLYVYIFGMLLERAAVVPALRLNYRLRFPELARMDLYVNLCYVAVTIGAAVGGLGGYSLALGNLARHGCKLLLLKRAGATLWPGRPPYGPGERRLAGELLGQALPLHLAGMAEFLTLYLDNVLCGKLYSAAAQGLYVVAYTLAMTPSDTIAMYGATAMVRALGLPEPAERQRALLGSLRSLGLFLFPIGALTALCAGSIERVLLPPRWYGVAPVVVGLCLGAMSQTVKRLAFAQLTALHRSRLAAVLEAGRLFTFLVAMALVWRLDPARAHMPWVGWGVSLSFALSAAVSLFVCLRADGLPASAGLRALLPPALGAAASALCVLALQRGLGRLGLLPGAPRLALELAVGIGAYGLYLRLVHGAIYREALGWLRAQIKKRG